MPAKIRIETVWEEIADRTDPSKEYITLRKGEFEDLVLGAGIASSRQTIKSLWAQARFSELNVYTGDQPDKRILLDMKALRDATSAKKCVYTYTHTCDTDPQEVA